MATRTEIDATWLGRRVVVRHFEAGGHSVDALGDLVALDERSVTVETRSGPTTVLRADIGLARPVEAAPREQYHLERITERGWRARETATTADGWLLRADAGWTGRANSALPLRTPTRPLDEVLADVAAWYREREQPSLIQVPLPAGDALDAALSARGWTSPDQALVLVARLDLLAAALPAASSARTVLVKERLDQAWLAAYEYRGRPLPLAAQALLERHPRVRFASIRATDETVLAHARGVVDADYLGITALGVRADNRRQGLARSVLAALVAWARSTGARRCYLQVSDSNAAALALYRALGFYKHHGYRYRTPPSIGS